MVEGQEKESREKKKNIGGCGGVKDQRIIIFLYIMFYSKWIPRKKKIYAIAKDKDSIAGGVVAYVAGVRKGRVKGIRARDHARGRREK